MDLHQVKMFIPIPYPCQIRQAADIKIKMYLPIRESSPGLHHDNWRCSPLRYRGLPYGCWAYK